jgi:hypothetical protein
LIWKPPKALGLGFALLMLAALTTTRKIVKNRMIGQEIGPGNFWRILWLVCNAAFLAVAIHWTGELIALRYELDRDALTIRSGAHRHVVPMEEIERIAPASNFHVRGALKSFRWPGYWRGTVHVEEAGDVRVHATKPLEQQLLVVTERGGYAISPQDRQGFLRDYAMRQSLGPLHTLTEGVEYGPVARWPVWHDALFWSLSAVGLLICLTLSGVLLWRYPELPERILFPFPPQKGVQRIASKARLLAMPGLGAVTLAVDTFLGILLHRGERLGAYLLMLIALGAEVIFTLALVSIL